MDWMSILGTVTGGGVLGFLNNIGTSILGIFKAREEHRQRMEERRLAIDELKLRGEQAREQQAAMAEQGREDTFRESIKSSAMSPAQTIYRWAATVIQLMRPGITIYLTIATSVIAFRGGISAEAAATAIIAYCGIAFGWWFGDRQASKLLSRNMLT
jgi:hypothetical protein